MIEAKSIYRAMCDNCGRHATIWNTENVITALAELTGLGWKTDYDGIWTLCPKCAQEVGKADA